MTLLRGGLVQQKAECGMSFWFIWNPVTKPALVPVIGGLAGLAYGSYDLSLWGVGQVVGAKK